MDLTDILSLVLFAVSVQQNIGTAGALDQCPSVAHRKHHFLKVFQDACYVFVNREMFWDDARDYCWAMGGEMLHIKNSATMSFIKQTLNSRELGWDKNGVWNGASDLRKVGWEWTTGEQLSYQFWASGEPSKLFSLISFENCCCMRRTDGWRWHDYHCHFDPYEYNFICQFPLMPKEHVTEQIHHAGISDADTLASDRVAIVGLAVGAVVLVVLFCSITFLLYRKHEQQKAQFEMQPSVRFQNTGYNSVMQNQSISDTSTTDGTDVTTSRPVSNIYLDPAELNGIYEDVNKHANHGRNVNSADSGIIEAPRLSYTGAAASAANGLEVSSSISSAVSEASGATSGYCSTSDPRQVTDGEYVEMNGATGVSSMKNGHAGKPCHTEVVYKGANGTQKNSNAYITVRKTPNEADSLLDYEKPSSKEMHIYTNQADSMDSLNLRPLPPIPCEDEKSPLFKHAVA